MMGNSEHVKRKQTSSASPFSRRYQREQKRRAILSEAARLFNVHGARATRLLDVAERLDLNKASLYYYIKSKDDLIYQTYLASCDAIEELLDRAEATGDTGAEKLASFIRFSFEAWQQIMSGERPHFAILTEIRALKQAHRRHVATRYSAMYGRIKSFIHDGIADSSVRPCRETDAALALFGLVQLTVLWLPAYEPAATGRAADHFIDIMFNGIAAERSTAFRPAGAVGGLSASAAEAAPGPGRQEAFCRVGSAFFNRKGFKATSLDDIADQLAVTKGAFYYNVRNKDDLLYQCFERSLALIAATQERAGAGQGSGLDVLQRCILELFEVQTGAAGPLIRFNLIPSLPARHRKKILSGIRRVSDGFGGMIEKGMADGSIRPVDTYIAEQMLISAIDLSAELPWMRPIEDGAEACGSYFGFYFNGLAARRR